MIRSILILAAAGSSSAFSPAARSPSSSTRLRLHDVEASVGSASWAGARFGDEFLAAGLLSFWTDRNSTNDSSVIPGYEAQCTHGHSSANSMDGSRAMPTGGHGYSRTETHERSKSLHAPTWVAGEERHLTLIDDDRLARRGWKLGLRVGRREVRGLRADQPQRGPDAVDVA
ncbi:hypothetical protein THAOC_16937 [Thalassiosira oceanica]|uniref:Uncharacterized protein n=1 Tax=Thalassiosira oceanica TaxID=159749 RepID=K0SAX5_THAOC|nr:hypothetical protein THAOC_16937 [Thalassiosira oceanica]|eukprot:EJK62455.1 hypothetical protein THAOC_16937 [Thalassiosira oceanica]